MSYLKVTPHPGYRLTPIGVKENIITKQFQEAFNNTFSGGKIKSPAFLSPRGILRITDMSIFSHEKFLSYDRLYFLIGEDGLYLHEALPESIAAYFRNLNPWEDANHWLTFTIPEVLTFIPNK